MAEYVEANQSEEPRGEEADLRVGEKLLLESLPGDRGVRATMHHVNPSVHRPETSEFAPDEQDDFLEYISHCTDHLFGESGSDEESGGPQVTVSEGE